MIVLKRSRAWKANGLNDLVDQQIFQSQVQQWNPILNETIYWGLWKSNKMPQVVRFLYLCIPFSIFLSPSIHPYQFNANHFDFLTSNYSLGLLLSFLCFCICKGTGKILQIRVIVNFCKQSSNLAWLALNILNILNFSRFSLIASKYKEFIKWKPHGSYL